MKKILGLVLSLTLISAVCAAVLAFVNALTKEPIARIQKEKVLSAAKVVMPAGVVAVEEKGGVFAGKDAAGKVVGYAVEGRDAGGYGGDIVLMVGFEADRRTVVCYRKLVASETPGLGSKLSSPEFADQFRGGDGAKFSVEKDGGAVEAIAAATITSRAVCRAVADAAARLAAPRPDPPRTKLNARFQK